MILPCSGGRTTKISAFYQIIERNYQGPKIFIKSKIVRKCLRRRNNYLSKMPLKEPITEPTYCKYRGLTYVTKCKYAPNSFHSQPQAYGNSVIAHKCDMVIGCQYIAIISDNLKSKPTWVTTQARPMIESIMGALYIAKNYICST